MSIHIHTRLLRRSIAAPAIPINPIDAGSGTTVTVSVPKMVGLPPIRRPPLPSSRVSTLAKTESLIATQRRTDFRGLQRVITGELDWVVMKCLEKNRGRRYDAAAGLAADPSRYLLDEPVSAARPSKVYQLRK